MRPELPAHPDHHETPFYLKKRWLLAGIVVLLALATGSATVLYLRRPHWDAPAAQSAPQDDSSIFVAPVGILDSDAKLTQVEWYEDTPPPAPPKLPDPVAPERLLDPAWQPAFSGA